MLQHLQNGSVILLTWRPYLDSLLWTEIIFLILSSLQFFFKYVFKLIIDSTY